MPHGRAQLTDARLADLARSEAAGLLRLARSLVRDDDRAADLVQATFLRALERRDQLRDGDPAAWLRRILYRLALDGHRRSARELLVEEVEDRWRRDDHTVDAAAVVLAAETRAELEEALVRLPFIYRSAVVLHDVEGLTMREVADLEGIGLPAAKQRLRRGRMLLVTALAAGAERRASLGGIVMRCWDARRHVSDYLDGDLPQADREAVEAHLATCPTCPPLYAALVGVHASLGELRDDDSVVPPALAERLQDVVSDAGR